MKRVLITVLLFSVALSAAAQAFDGVWGSTDIRYPSSLDSVPDVAVDKAIAWRGERVNFQLVVTNKGFSDKERGRLNGMGLNEWSEERRFEYIFSDLKCGGSVIPAANIAGGFVEPVITDKFIGCGRHEVDAYGENLVADRITAGGSAVITAALAGDPLKRIAKVTVKTIPVQTKSVEVLPGDTPETLQRRIMEQAEWILLPQAIEKVAKELGK